MNTTVLAVPLAAENKDGGKGEQDVEIKTEDTGEVSKVQAEWEATVVTLNQSVQKLCNSLSLSLAGSLKRARARVCVCVCVCVCVLSLIHI